MLALRPGYFQKGIIGRLSHTSQDSLFIPKELYDFIVKQIGDQALSIRIRMHGSLGFIDVRIASRGCV